LSSVDKEKAVL